MLEFRKAFRKSVPMLLGISGVSGSGKTYSALLLASGIAGKGRVGMLDAENGRGEMYADSPGIVKAYPNGFDYMRLDPPFSPGRYLEGIEVAEKAGLAVLIVDSASHEWEGIGGCCEIAEAAKKMPDWKKAKRLHKRFLNHCLSSNMHIIFCLRAREKIKMIKVMRDGKEKTEPVDIGIRPITEKNFVFEMLVSLRIEEETHHVIPLKVPEPLVGLFPKGVLLTKEHGEHIREWNDTGSELAPGEQLKKRAAAAAEDGMDAYQSFYGDLTAGEKKLLRDSTHNENKRIAIEADEARAADPTEAEMKHMTAESDARKEE